MTNAEQTALDRIKYGAATEEDWQTAGPYLKAVLRFAASLVPFPYPGHGKGPNASQDRCGHPACQRLIGHGALVVFDGRVYWHHTCHPTAKEVPQS